MAQDPKTDSKNSLQAVTEIVQSISDVKAWKWKQMVDQNDLSLPESERKNLDSWSEKLHIDKDSLRDILAFLETDPRSIDPQEQKERDQALEKVLETIKTHIPEPSEGVEFSQEDMQAWKDLTAKVSQSIETLEKAWDDVAFHQVEYQNQVEKTTAELETRKKQLAEYKQDFNNMQVELDKLQPAIMKGMKEPTPEAAEALQKASELTQKLATLSPIIELERTEIDKIANELQVQQEQLTKTTNMLAHKTFELNAAMMLNALPEKVEHITGPRVATLEEKSKEAQEVSEQLKDHARDYKIAAKELSGLRVEIGKMLEKCPIKMVHNLGAAIIDKQLDRVYEKNARNVEKTLDKMNKDMSKAMKKINGNPWNKISNAYIEKHTNKAMKELKAINKLEDKIQSMETTLQERAMAKFKPQFKDELQKMKESAEYQQASKEEKAQQVSAFMDKVKQSPEYQKVLADTQAVALDKLKAEKAEHMQSFKDEFTKVKTATAERQKSHDEWQHAIDKVKDRIADMKDEYQLSAFAQFKTLDSFDVDLKNLLAKNGHEMEQIMNNSSQDVQKSIEDMFQDHPDWDRGR